MRVEVLHPAKFELGEGLFWDINSDFLWGVDIENHSAWNYSLQSKKLHQFDVGEKIGWCYPHADGSNLLLGKKSGVYLVSRNFDPRTIKAIPIPGLTNRLRLNDAKPDCNGGILGGVMEDSSEVSMPKGFLYSLNKNGVVRILDDGYYIPNGPAISRCGTMLLHTDSYLRVIYAFDFDSSRSEIKNKKIWKKFSIEDGHPDGMCFDSFGNLWIAFWGSGIVRKFNLDGDVLGDVRFPCSQVSNVCYAGGDLTRLFVTTAFSGLTFEQKSKQPFAGTVFEIIGHETVGLPVMAPDIHVGA